MLRGERGDGRGVDAAAEEDAERHVGHESALNGAFESGADLFAERMKIQIRCEDAEQRLSDDPSAGVKLAEVAPSFLVSLEGERTSRDDFRELRIGLHDELPPARCLQLATREIEDERMPAGHAW